jgi:hypothetical protein
MEFPTGSLTTAETIPMYVRTSAATPTARMSKLADGIHTLAITSLCAVGQYATISQNFTVANAAANPITISIDNPSAQNAALSG